MKDEMDILKEMGTISAGQGSIALSEIIGRKINLKVPALTFLSRADILNRFSEDQIVVSILGSLLTGIEGKILFLLDEKSAYKLIDMCYGRKEDEKQCGIFTEMGMSLMKEVGNVVISSFIGALSILLKSLIIPSIPTLVNGPIKQILNMVLASEDEYVLFIETTFEEPQQQITGSFYLVLTPQTVQFIQAACKKMLETINKS
ncbi:MAG: chemotaxis protein CheC [Candidatus Omnitrophota bacterium]|jgi:chemotaxis protein CheC